MLAPTRRRSARRLALVALTVATLVVAEAAAALAMTPRFAVQATAERLVAERTPAPGGTAIVPGSVDHTSLQVSASYDVTARLRIADRVVRGRVAITARNDSGADIDGVRLNTTMGPLGGLELGSVTVDGSAAEATLDDQTITVALGGLLPDGASTMIVVPFRATLRSTTSGSTWLFTRANGIVSMYRWVPWISRATPFDRPNFGDPFVTPVSPAATLRLETDVPTRVVVNGTRTSISDDGLVTTWSLENVRDIVVNAAPDYGTTSRTVDGVELRVTTRPGERRAAVADAAERALRRLTDRLGAYPWPVLRIVQSSGGYGMEGPGIVWIPAGVASGNLPYLLAHEIGHQWFYGLVGNDQAREPFADEAVNDMVARFVTGTRRGSRCSRGRLDLAIYDYSSACYYERVYIQGGNLLDDARRRMGNRVYFPALRRYLADHRWGLVHTRTLLDALDDATSLDLASAWSDRFPSLYP